MAGWIATIALSALAGVAGGAGPAAAEAVISGRPAQALRCASYIVMAGQYGYDAGRLTAGDRAVMAGWSAAVLETWVPLDLPQRMSAYGAALGELGAQDRSRTLVSRHAEWCLRAFTPGLL